MDLKEYLHERVKDANLVSVIEGLAQVSNAIHNGFLAHSHVTQGKNVYGETQLEIDVWSNDLLKQYSQDNPLVSQFASEEEAEVIHFENKDAQFGITVDPLDGSSNIKTNLAVGTIVGIYGHGGNVMAGGRGLVAALYIIYGPLMQLVGAVDGHVFKATWDGPSAQYLMTEVAMRLGDKKIYAPGGIKAEWPSDHKAYIEWLENAGYKLRYSGAFVADINQILHYGGLFTYPATAEKPEGKLRLLAEGLPMAYIITQAGGAASTGTQDMLDIVPQKCNQRIPFYIGSKDAVQKAEEFLKK